MPMPKITCPQCGGKTKLLIEYGTPDEAMIQKIEAGTILHGGCAIAGLMQPYYCPQCDLRYDEQCTSQFMRALKKLSFHSATDVVEIDFLPNQLSFSRNGVQKTRSYTANLHEALAHTQLEFWASTTPSTWTLRMELRGYFQEVIELQGTQKSPVAFKRWLIWLDSLTQP